MEITADPFTAEGLVSYPRLGITPHAGFHVIQFYQNGPWISLRSGTQHSSDNVQLLVVGAKIILTQTVEGELE